MNAGEFSRQVGISQELLRQWRAIHEVQFGKQGENGRWYYGIEDVSIVRAALHIKREFQLDGTNIYGWKQFFTLAEKLGELSVFTGHYVVYSSQHAEAAIVKAENLESSLRTLGYSVVIDAQSYAHFFNRFDVSKIRAHA